MKNWTQRFAVRAVFGILISGALLAGCSSNQASDPASAGTNTNTDSSGKPIDLENQGKPAAGAPAGAAASAPKGEVPKDSAGNPITLK